MDWFRALATTKPKKYGIIPPDVRTDYLRRLVGDSKHVYAPSPFPKNKAMDNMLRYAVSPIPGIGDLARFYDNSRAMDDYLRNRGISWEDVKYPSRFGTYSSNALGNMITQVPDAYQRLYDIDNPRQEYVKFYPEFHSEMPRASRRYYHSSRLLR